MNCTQIFYLLLLVLLTGCAPVPETAEIIITRPEPVPGPLFRSAKQVSSDCGVVAVVDPPPGFAVPPGAEAKVMPPIIAGFQKIVAEREPAVTDPERVSGGYVLIEPLVVRQCA